MKNHSVLLLLLFLFLPACKSTEKFSEEQSTHSLVDLVNSTKIIRTLLIQNRLSELLESHNPEQLEILLDNFSPAQMALEVEVLSATHSLIVVYYFKDNSEEQKFIQVLNQLAIENEDTIKFVVIDADKLFSLAQYAEIEKYPTVLFVKNREIIDDIEGEISLDLLKQRMKMLSVPT